MNASDRDERIGRLCVGAVLSLALTVWFVVEGVQLFGWWRAVGAAALVWWVVVRAVIVRRKTRGET